MGCVTGYKKIMELLGHDVIMPNKPTQKTIDLGVKYSPEFICFPFKVMLGTYIESIEKGAEVIISSGGHGPCRAGLYGEVHSKILHGLDYKVEIIVFDAITRDFKTFWKNLRGITNGKSLVKLARDIIFVYYLICQMDNLEKKTKILRAYEENIGEVNRVWEEIKAMYDKCWTFRDLKNISKQAQEMLKAIPLTSAAEKDKIRIGIVGEIYVAMESSVNMDIEQKLNNMGIEVENVQYISGWLRHNLDFLGVGKSYRVIEKAKQFVKINCGGHDMENIGWMVDFKERGFDAIVHLMPFACLPELVSQSIIPTISKELDIPILSLSLDEQSGIANNQTRIEAFIDLILNKKQKEHFNLQGASKKKEVEWLSESQSKRYVSS
jgi:predicted nucleotide-binding protein (sugar kinase/HSP70/actin superfamily)